MAIEVAPGSGSKRSPESASNVAPAGKASYLIQNENDVVDGGIAFVSENMGCDGRLCLHRDPLLAKDRKDVTGQIDEIVCAPFEGKPLSKTRQFPFIVEHHGLIPATELHRASVERLAQRKIGPFRSECATP